MTKMIFLVLILALVTFARSTPSEDEVNELFMRTEDFGMPSSSRARRDAVDAIVNEVNGRSVFES